jgi:uncharacterized glyoxalase superfamily protein PhnB
VTESSASATVSVAVEPMIAFTAFTDEIDFWWVRGAINFFDAARAVAMRIEPGVGGRVLEIYDEARGDALELGQITAWEPGVRLTYRSLVDDTEVDVRFDAVEGGTQVRVTQTLLPGGERAFLFWPNVLHWLVPWCDRRAADSVRREIARVSIALYYEDPAGAARWLARVFQLGSWSGIPAEGEEPSWIELHHGNVAVLLFPLDGQPLQDATVTHMPWVYVDDLDAHFAHTKSAGANIVSEIEQHGYRAYTAEDVEGRRWTFAQARPTME